MRLHLGVLFAHSEGRLHAGTLRLTPFSPTYMRSYPYREEVTDSGTKIPLDAVLRIQTNYPCSGEEAHGYFLYLSLGRIDSIVEGVADLASQARGQQQ